MLSCGTEGPIKVSKTPLVTVCIPTYNQEEYIEGTIESVLSQGIDDIQIIISDDSSQDKTPDILKRFKKKHPNLIEIFLHKKNQGVSKNISSMYPHIRGKYVCWIGGDDVFLPNKLRKQLEFMEANPLYVMSYHNVWVQDQHKGSRYKYNGFLGQKSFSGKIDRDLIINRCFVSAMSIMVRKSVVKTTHHNVSLGPSNDWLFAIEVSMKGPVKFLDEVLGIYYRHEKNITRTQITHEREEEIYDYLEKKYGRLYKPEIQKGRSTLYINYFFKYVFLKRYQEAFHLLKKLKILYEKSPRLLVYSLSKIPIFFLKHFLLWIKTGSMHR